MLESISDEMLIIGVFAVLSILNVINIFNNGFYSADKDSKRAMDHVLNVKYKLYKNKKIDVRWINRSYGFFNIFLSLTTPIIFLTTSGTVGIIYYLLGMVLGNIIVNKLIINKYCG